MICWKAALNTPGRQALANPGGESLGGGKEPADLFVKGG